MFSKRLTSLSVIAIAAPVLLAGCSEQGGNATNSGDGPTEISM